MPSGAGLVYLNYLAASRKLQEVTASGHPDDQQRLWSALPREIRVPPGFIVPLTFTKGLPQSTTSGLTEEIEAEIDNALLWLGQQPDVPGPLLVSVRSGGRTSVPGLMSTVLNVGILPSNVFTFERELGPVLTLDTYRRFLASYGRTVLRVPEAEMERAEELAKGLARSLGIVSGPDANRITCDALLAMYGRFKEPTTSRSREEQRRIDGNTDALWEQRPNTVIKCCVAAVIRSAYQPHVPGLLEMTDAFSDPNDQGTAVVVQRMVLGNRATNSGAGVFFSRDPNRPTLNEQCTFIPAAQGADLLKPESQPLGPESTSEEADPREGQSLWDLHPEPYRDLKAIGSFLEFEFGVCEIEFVIENDRLWLLQFRQARLSAHAAVRYHTRNEVMTRDDAMAALLQITPSHVRGIAHGSVDLEGQPFAHCEVLSAGIATGIACFDVRRAERLSRTREGRELGVILIQQALPVEEVRILRNVQGLVSVTGWPASHVMSFARSSAVPVVKLAGWNYRGSELRASRADGVGFIREGDPVTIDGMNGRLYKTNRKSMPTDSHVAEQFRKVIEWTETFRRPIPIDVRLSTNDPEAIREAFDRYCITGVGLCRTELFFDPRRAPPTEVSQLVPQLATMVAYSMARPLEWSVDETEMQRRLALEAGVATKEDEFVAGEREHFRRLLDASGAHSVAIRLLDRVWANELREAILASGLPSDIRDTALSIIEHDDGDLGIRGVRIGLAFPRIYRAQIRAILLALLDLRRDRSGGGSYPSVDILLPLVSHRFEIEWVQHLLRSVVSDLLGADEPADGRQAVESANWVDGALRRQARELVKQVPGSQAVDSPTAADHLLAAVNCRLGIMVETPHALAEVGDLARDMSTVLVGSTDLTQLTFGTTQASASLIRDFFESHQLACHERGEDRSAPAPIDYPLFRRSLRGQLLSEAIAGVQPQNDGTPTFGLAGSHVTDRDTLRALVDVVSDHGRAYVSADFYELPIVLLLLGQFQIQRELASTPVVHRPDPQST